MDGGGGGMGQGTSQNKWTPGYDGVRVSVVRASDHSVVTTPIDLTNQAIPGSVYHFGKVSKLQYSGGAGLSPEQGSYVYVNPSQALPRIVSSSGTIRKALCHDFRHTGQKHDKRQQNICCAAVIHFYYSRLKSLISINSSLPRFMDRVGCHVRTWINGIDMSLKSQRRKR